MACGLIYPAQNLFHCYLDNYSASVPLNEKLSIPFKCHRGALLGSLLVLMLFAIFLNKGLMNIPWQNIIRCATDIVITKSGTSDDYIKSNFQQDLSLLSLWLEVEWLNMNISKTKSFLSLNPESVK